MRTQLDKKEFRKRVVLRLLTRPLTLVPLLAGATLLMGAWALGLKAGLSLFAGTVSVLVGMGAFFTRLLAGDQGIEKLVLANMNQEAEAQRDADLDDLEQRLAEDGDPRTEQALRDLRVLAAAFEEGKAWSGDINTQSSFDILSGVDQLFRTCVDYLRKTLELWSTARAMETAEVRAPILGQRERLIEDVQASTRHISGILARVQTLGPEADQGAELGHIRAELDASLEVAKKVQERIASWRQPAYDRAEMERSGVNGTQYDGS